MRVCPYCGTPGHTERNCMFRAIDLKREREAKQAEQDKNQALLAKFKAL